MKAAILVKNKKPLILADIKIPKKLEIGQVLVKILYSGICGAQINEIDAVKGKDNFLPHLLGHEGSGIVEKIGPGVTTVKKGDHVVLHWRKSKGIQSAPPKYKWNKKIVNAGWVTTFQEYSVVSENRVTKISDDIPLDSAALLGCSVPTGAGMFMKESNLGNNSSVCIFGAGGIGLNAIQAARLRGAKIIIVVDINENKLQMAKNFGGTHFINAVLKDPIDEIRKIVPNGVDFSFESVGSVSVMEQAYEIANDEIGKVILAGVTPTSDKISIDPYPLHFGKILTGTSGGFSNPDVDFDTFLNLYKSKKWKLDELITHRLKLEDINLAVEILKKGSAGRILIEMDS